MQTIPTLMERVNNSQLSIKERYTELYDLEKKNIVFVSPFFNKHGLYRMILPALELMETKQFSCIITNILPEDNTKTIDDFSVKLIPEVIRWADYIVFQANGQDMTGLIKSLKEINPKIKVVLDVDRNYHALNPNNYASKKYTVAKQRNLEKNLTLVDFSTYPDKLTEDFYIKKAGVPIKTKILPNLLSPYQFENISKAEPIPATDKKLRVLLMADQDDFDDINSFRETINQIQVRVPESKIYVLGNGITYDTKNSLRLVNYVRVPYNDMSEYYKIIKRVSPFAIIIPAKKQAFFRNYYKIMEAGAFGIPILAMNEYPFNHILKKDTHIMLAGQKKTFIENLRTLVDNPETKKRLSHNLQLFIQEKYSWNNPNMAKFWMEAFF
jgi:glycosyltransferase involved in cell wall biosynthesis